MSDEPVIWDHAAGCERPQPSKSEIEAVEVEVIRQLSSLGGMQGISVALDAISALLYAETFRVGSRDFTKYLALMVKFITRRVRQYERSDEILPADIREGMVH